MVCTLMLFACNPYKKKDLNKDVPDKQSSFLGYDYKKIPVDSILGKWEIRHILFREPFSGKDIAGMSIKKEQVITLEFMKDGRLLINKDSTAKWYAEDYYLIINGENKTHYFPFFLNTKYRFMPGRLSALLTCFFNADKKPDHEVRYRMVKLR